MSNLQCPYILGHYDAIQIVLVLVVLWSSWDCNDLCTS